MKKERKNFLDNPALRQTVVPPAGDVDPDCTDVDTIMSVIQNNPMLGAMMSSLSEDQYREFMLMLELYIRNVPPAQYNSFYSLMETTYKNLGNIESFGRFGNKGVKEYPVMEDAGEKTLVLKIQMKDVTKPPMWREVEIPADVDFVYLHHVIQTVTGLENCHLWQFNKTAYNGDLLIGLSGDDESWGGLEYVTNEANETPVTTFLQKKGDKLEYVYDFGDDWIFKVEVKCVLDKRSECPVCLKYKSELNPAEDFGGVWGYQTMREDLEQWGTLTKKECKKRAGNQGFDSAEDYHEFLEDQIIDIDSVNEELAEMKRK